MFALIPVLTSIALVDSTSITPICIVPLTMILAGRRPYTTAFSFLLGLFLSYVAMALAFLFGLSSVFDRLNAWLTHKLNHPEPADLGLQIAIGVVLVIFGLRIAMKRQEVAGRREASPPITVGGAFGLAAMMNIVGFPGAVPYFAAADQILRADLPATQMTLCVLYYVLIFCLPLASLVLLRALLGARGNEIMARVKSFFDVWGRRVLIVVLVGLGLVLVVDGIMFLNGRPLLPVGTGG